MNNLHRMVLSFLVLSLVLLCGCGGDGGEPSAGIAPEPADESQKASTSEESSSEGETEPIYITFEGTDLGGNPVTQDIFSQSQLTMVNIWATYCNPCLSEMPGLGELASEYDAEDFQIIGVVSDVAEGSDQSLAESLVRETGADYPHLLLNESLYYALLTDVSAVPTTRFLDAEGNVLDTVVGAMEKADWKELIDGFLEDA